MDKQLIKAYVKNWVANGMKEDVISSGKQVKKAKKIKPTTGKMTIDKMSNKERYKIIGNHYRIHDVVITQDDLNKELNLFDEATYDKTVKQVAKASKISLAQAIEYVDQVIVNRESFIVPNLRYLIKAAINAKFDLSRYQKKHASIEQEDDDGNNYSMLDAKNYSVLNTNIEIIDLFKDNDELLKIVNLLVEGYNQQEIAQKMQSSQSTIHRRIREIRQIIINNL
jgi:hypothetical protein